MFNAKRFAYAQVRNYICSQIAYEIQKLNDAKFDEVLNADYIEELEAYKTMLNVLSNEKDRICK